MCEKSTFASIAKSVHYRLLKDGRFADPGFLSTFIHCFALIPLETDLRVRSQGVCLQCEQVGERVLQKRTSALLGAKTSEFSKFMLCPHGQGGEFCANVPQ